jgi:hypothetical protein
MEITTFRRQPTLSRKVSARRALLHRGFVLEYVTLAWNVVLAITAVAARSVRWPGSAWIL